MKRILLMAVMAAVCIGAKADYREGNLIGKWELAEGDPYYDVPTMIWFKEDGTCEYSDGRGTLHCEGFVVSSDGRQIHLFSGTDFNGSDRFVMINLFLSFCGVEDGDYSKVWLRVESYDRKSWSAKLLRNDDASAVRAATGDGEAGHTKYDLRGVAADSPRGLYIQDGRKMLDR